MGRRQLNVVVSLAQHGQVRAAAAALGVSMQEWLVEAVREKVERDGAGEFGAGSGRSVVADVGGSRFDSQRGGEGDVGVVVDPVADAVAFAARLGEREDLYLTRPLAVFNEFATQPPPPAAAPDPIHDIA